MSNEFNAKNGLIIQYTQPISGISNTTIVNNDNSLVTEGQIYRELTGKTNNDIFTSYTASTYNEITGITQNTLSVTSSINSHTGDTSIHFTKESLDSVFVNTSGDTMTGNLYVPTISATTYYGYGGNLTGLITANDYTTGATFNNNIIYFDRTDTLSAYTVNLSYLDNKNTITGLTSDFNSHTGDTSIHYELSSITLSNIGSSAHTHSISEVNNLQSSLNGKSDLSGSTFTGSVIASSLSATTISATTIYGDASNLTGLPKDINYYTTGTTLIGNNVYFNRNDTLSAYTLNLTQFNQSNDISSLNNVLSGHTGDTSIHFTKESLDSVFVNTSGDTMTGNLYVPTLSANTISGGTLYGNGSNLTGIVTSARKIIANNTVGSVIGGGDLSLDRTLTLQGDSVTPGNSKYYGTNSSGTKGFYDLPSGSTGSTTYTAGSGITISGNAISVNIIGLPLDETPEGTDFIMYQSSGGTLERAAINTLPVISMFRYSLPEGINNTAVYFYSWSKTSTATNSIRSGNNAGLPYADACSPIVVNNDGFISEASLVLGGAGVQAGSPVYPVIYSAQVWSVGFASEGTLRGTLTWSIPSGNTVGGYSVSTTNYKGSTGNVNIPCSAGDLLAVKFVNGNSASSVGQMLNAFITIKFKSN